MSLFLGAFREGDCVWKEEGCRARWIQRGCWGRGEGWTIGAARWGSAVSRVFSGLHYCLAHPYHNLHLFHFFPLIASLPPPDFDAITEETLKEHCTGNSVFFSCMGTTRRQAGSAVSSRWQQPLLKTHITCIRVESMPLVITTIMMLEEYAPGKNNSNDSRGVRTTVIVLEEYAPCNNNTNDLRAVLCLWGVQS